MVRTVLKGDDMIAAGQDGTVLCETVALLEGVVNKAKSELRSKSKPRLAGDQSKKKNRDQGCSYRYRDGNWG